MSEIPGILANNWMNQLIQLSDFNGPLWIWFGWCSGFMVGAMMVWILVSSLYRRSLRPYYDPQKLFRQLCRLHRLSSNERDTIVQFSKHLGLDNACCLFVDPFLWHALDRNDISVRLYRNIFGQEMER